MNPIAYAGGVISEWTRYCDKSPKAFIDAVGLFEHLQGLELHRLPTVDIKGVTADNSLGVVRGIAQQIYLAEASAAHHGGPLDKAKNLVLEAAARNLLDEAKAATPAIAGKVAQLLEKVAREYVEAVTALPDDVVTPRELLDSIDVPIEEIGDYDFSHVTEYKKTYEKAKSARAELEHLASWVASTRLVLDNEVKVDSVLLLLRPTNTAELDKLDEARFENHDSQALLDLNPVFFTAAKSGIPWGINLAQDWASLRQELAPAAA